jgi:hypothetical protein
VTAPKSGYEGVSWNAQRDRWTAKVTIGGRRRHVGSFTCPAAAARAIEQARANPDAYLAGGRALKQQQLRSPQPQRPAKPEARRLPGRLFWLMNGWT